MTAVDPTGWVRRTRPPANGHDCAQPMREIHIKIPSGPAWKPGPSVWHKFGDVVDGERNDLWRCPDCRKLWRIGYACAACEQYGYGNHGGQHVVGDAWLPATGWQRFTTWLRRR